MKNILYLGPLFLMLVLILNIIIFNFSFSAETVAQKLDWGIEQLRQWSDLEQNGPDYKDGNY